MKDFRRLSSTLGIGYETVFFLFRILTWVAKSSQSPALHRLKLEVSLWGCIAVI